MAAITISTPEDLIAFCSGSMGTGSSSEYLTVSFSNDIDFATLPNDNTNKYNFPGSTQTFYANINGNGHKILNMAFSNSAEWQLFGTVAGSISNLTIIDLNVTLCSNFNGFAKTTALEMNNCHMVAHVMATGSIYCLCYRTSGDVNFYYCSTNGEYEITGTGDIYTISNSGIARECQIKGSFNCSNTRTSGRAIYILGGVTTAVSVYAIDVTIKGFRTLGTALNCNFCYVTFANGAEIEAKGYTNSGFFPANVFYANSGSYYANDEWTGGNKGVPKSQLQSQSWLRERGWAI